MKNKVDKIAIFKKPRYHVAPQLKSKEEFRDYFYTNGFAVIPNAISPGKISELRNICDDYSTNKGKLEMFSSEFLSTKEFAEIPFDPKIVEQLKFLLGDNFTIYPNFTMRSNLYTKWHIDKAFWNNKDYLFDDSFKHIQCAIYLQDNNPGNCSGLDVIPGSHKNRLVMGGRQSFLTRKFRYLGSLMEKPLSLQTKAGDLILFDARLIHQGSQPNGSSNQGMKYAIYWSTSVSNEQQVNAYLTYLFNKVEMIKYERTVQSADRFSDLRTISYPESFDHVLESIKGENIKIATFNNL